MRNLLIISCLFNVPIDNLDIMTIDDIKINYTTPFKIVFIDSQEIRIVTNTPVGVFRQTYFTVSFTNRYQLYSSTSALTDISLNDSQRRLG